MVAVTVVDDPNDDLPEIALDGTQVEPVAADFDLFYEASHDALFRALALTLNDHELARDAASEGMARALQRWHTVSRYRNPAGWTYRVGLNWARSRLRKFRREVRTDSDAQRVVSDAVVIDPRLDGALDALPVEQRAVVVLRYYLDWSEQQTAAALQVAPGTVKSRLSRALDRLAISLEDPHGTR